MTNPTIRTGFIPASRDEFFSRLGDTRVHPCCVSDGYDERWGYLSEWRIGQRTVGLSAGGTHLQESVYALRGDSE